MADDKGQLAVTHLRGNPIITQSPNGNTSHVGSMSYDFAYSGKANVPLYAPFDMKCVAVDRGNAFSFWESLKEVRCADGTTSFVTFNTGHSNDHAKNNVGDIKKKGEVYAYTGVSGNVTGDHTHIESSKGKFKGMWDGWSMPKPVHDYFDIFSTCDNVTKVKVNFTDQSGGHPKYRCILDWVDGEGGSGGNEGGGNEGGETTTYDLFTLEVFHKPYFKPELVETGNIWRNFQDRMESVLKVDSKIFEPQLLSNEFTGIVVSSGWGNSFNYDLKYIPKLSDNQLIVSGGVFDSNSVHYTLANYIRELYSDKKEWEKQGHDRLRFNHGFTDNNPRSLTVISSVTDSFLQANKNRYESQNKSFIENKNMMDKQLALNERSTNLTNQMSTTNANFGFASSMIGGTLGLIGGTASLMSGVGFLNGVNTIGGMAQTGLGMGQAYSNYKYNDDVNELRSQSNSLNAQNSKLAYNQSLRSFNASIKDMNNQPSSISQLGNDVSYNRAYQTDFIYLEYKTPQDDLFLYSYNYLKLFGVKTNKIDNINTFFNQRQNFNYISGLFLDEIECEINQDHLVSFKNIFSTGVRVWECSDNIDNDFLNTDIRNEDK